MKKYFKLSLAFTSISLKRFFEHRWNAYGNLSQSALLLLLTVFFIEIIFSQTPRLAGWEKYEILFLVGFFRLIVGLVFILFIKSIDFLPGYIKSGELDIILTKPVNSQFFVSLRHIRLYELGQLLPALVLMVIAFNNLQNVFTLINLCVFLLGLFAGVLIMYCIYFLIATLAIWTINMEALPEFQYATNNLISYPLDIFGAWGKFILTFIIPLAFVVSFPVEVMLGKSSIFLIIIGLGISLLLLTLTIWFWNFALRHYTSASS